MLARWLWLIIGSAAIGGVIAYVLVSRSPATYEASVSLLVGPSLDAGTIDLGDIQLGQALAPIYADLATTRPILDKVLAVVGVQTTADELSKNIVAQANSNLLTITVTAGSAKAAAGIANELATQLANVGPRPSSSAGPFLTVVDPAVAPTQAAGPRTLSSTAIGAGIGFLVAIAIAFLVENLRRADALASDRI